MVDISTMFCTIGVMRPLQEMSEPAESLEKLKRYCAMAERYLQREGLCDMLQVGRGDNLGIASARESWGLILDFDDA